MAIAQRLLISMCGGCEAGGAATTTHRPAPSLSLTALYGALLLALLAGGAVSSYPLLLHHHPASGGRITASSASASSAASSLLERRWETLFSRSILGVSSGSSAGEPSWESGYLLGIKRVRRLYCNVGIGFHLQVLPDGTISGAHQENQYSE